MPVSAALGVHDTSPIWTYNGGWRIVRDNEGANTRHISTARDANVTLNFNSTAIELRGYVKANHGDFVVYLDGQSSNVRPASQDMRGLGDLLFSAQDLSAGTHEITLVDQRTDSTQPSIEFERGFVTLGWAGVSYSPDTTVPLAMNADNITYNGTWVNGTSSSTIYGTETYHTNVGGSSATIQFYGNGIDVNGLTGPNQGTYTVQLDHGPLIPLNATTNFLQHEDVLYLANQLPLTDHVLTIRKSSGDNKDLVISSSNVYRWPERGSIISSAAAAPTWANNDTDGSDHHGLGGAAIGGIVGGILGAFVLIGVLFVLLRKRRQGRASLAKDVMVSDAASGTTIATSVAGKKDPQMAELKA